ncbi:hypothetical protein F2P81_011163 [Scophthalmus maximus]|uniref:ORM1-like protein 2 n=1 Tax=Scophthalmus maximus TaxID=52904 RepID=A0A6A4SXT5_SCOMX|nr:hypothetical protein F2P81_011163 [Scophthalmus maximus]
MTSPLAALLLLLSLIAAASCAPAAAGRALQGACAAVQGSALELNHIAQALYLQAQSGEKEEAGFYNSPAWIEAKDMCDPASLEHNSAPCVGKMLGVLTSYNALVERVSGFESLACKEFASKVQKVMQKLHKELSACVKSRGAMDHAKQANVSEEETPVTPRWQVTPHWQDLQCNYTRNRLFSFSILTARVFAVGDPAHHAESSAQKCHGNQSDSEEGGVRDKTRNFLVSRDNDGRMNVGVAHSEVNPNTRVMNSRGIWLTYLLLTVVLHVVLLSIPFFTVPLVWTLTNVIHNLVMYLFLHTVKGTPFETPDQGKARLLTHWEQMDYGVQFTSSRKFLTISPIILRESYTVMYVHVIWTLALQGATVVVEKLKTFLNYRLKDHTTQNHRHPVESSPALTSNEIFRRVTELQHVRTLDFNTSLCQK